MLDPRGAGLLGARSRYDDRQRVRKMLVVFISNQNHPPVLFLDHPIVLLASTLSLLFDYSFLCVRVLVWTT